MGEVGGTRHYDGPGLGFLPWKCPACGVENAGPLALGCTACGSGKPGQRVSVDRQPPQVDPRPPIYAAAERWQQQNPTATIADAFVAGYQMAQLATMNAPPVTADILAPAGKTVRTIIAALKLFRDRVIADSPEEVETGEWCTAEEIAQLIQQIREGA